MSHDIEDIITVIDGRDELITEIRLESPEIKSYLATEFERLISDEGFLESIPGHLLPDSASQSRAPIIEKRIGEIIRIGK